MKNFRAVFLSLRINIIIYKADIPHIVGGKMIKCVCTQSPHNEDLVVIR